MGTIYHRTRTTGQFLAILRELRAQEGRTDITKLDLQRQPVRNVEQEAQANGCRARRERVALREGTLLRIDLAGHNAALDLAGGPKVKMTASVRIYTRTMYTSPNLLTC